MDSNCFMAEGLLYRRTDRTGWLAGDRQVPCASVFDGSAHAVQKRSGRCQVAKRLRLPRTLFSVYNATNTLPV